MTKKEFLNLPAFKEASDNAEVWIQSPGIDDYIPIDAWVLPFADGSQNLIIETQKSAEYLDKDKIYAIMTKLTNLSYSQLIPINSNEFKRLHEITSEVRSLLDYPIEQKPAAQDRYKVEKQ